MKLISVLVDQSYVVKRSYIKLFILIPHDDS